MNRIDIEIYLGDFLYSLDYKFYGIVTSLETIKKEIVVVFRMRNLTITRTYKVSDLGKTIFFNSSDACCNRNPYEGKYSVYFRQYNRKVQQHIDFKNRKSSTRKTDKNNNARKFKIKPSWTYLPYVVGEPHVEDNDFFPFHRRRKKP